MNEAVADELAALQTALAAEHAAVYAYGVAGASLTGADRDRAAAAFDDCRRRRDQLAEGIKARDGEPVAAAAAYRLPYELTSADRARALAAYVEGGLADAYAGLVAAAATAGLRELAAEGLTAATVRGLAWGSALATFPGLTR